MIIVMNEGDDLFTSTGDFEIMEVLAGTSLSEIDVNITIIPESFELGDAFPNPFNPNTAIQFTLGQNGFISLNIFDVQGRLINSLINNSLSFISL